MESSPRADRRHHAARMKARARKVYPRDPDARLADHLACCSCPTCGNPRRHFGGDTVQERRAMTLVAFEADPDDDVFADLWDWKYERYEWVPIWSKEEVYRYDPVAGRDVLVREGG